MISSNTRCRASPIRKRSSQKIFLGWKPDQTAGGGRTKLVKTGRKTTNVSRAKCAIATGLTIGSTLTVTAAGPRLGAEQIEQEWWDVRELIGCEWTACTVPMAQT